MVQEMGYRALEGFVLNNLGEARLMEGDVSQAMDLLERALEVADESGEKRLIFDILRNQSQAAVKLMGREDALEIMDEALDLAEELDSQALLGIGLQSLADVHAHYVFDAAYSEQSKAQAAQKKARPSIQRSLDAKIGSYRARAFVPSKPCERSRLTLSGRRTDS